jgi:ketosteroid isomerase-like protein
MGTSVPYQVVKDFYDAFASRDPLRVAPFLADDVQWHMAGPVDIFHFCGYRRGKAAVLDYLTRLVPQVFAVRRFEPMELVIDGNRAGVFSNVSAVQKNTGRVIAYHCAHFMVFKDDKVVSMQGVTDTFDVVEQLVGHRIDPYRESQAASASDVVAI